MAYSQKYCLVQFLDTLPVGYEFTRTDWPLHCTLAGVFAWDWNEQTRDELQALIATRTPFRSVVTEPEWFGEAKDVAVMLVRPTPELSTLHETIADFITQHDGIFNQPAYLYDQFRPHVTRIGENPVSGTEVNFHKLSLIDMFPGGDHTRRRVIAEFPLGS